MAEVRRRLRGGGTAKALTREVPREIMRLRYHCHRGERVHNGSAYVTIEAYGITPSYSGVGETAMVGLNEKIKEQRKTMKMRKRKYAISGTL